MTKSKSIVAARGPLVEFCWSCVCHICVNSQGDLTDGALGPRQKADESDWWGWDSSKAEGMAKTFLIFLRIAIGKFVFVRTNVNFPTMIRILTKSHFMEIWFGWPLTLIVPIDHIWFVYNRYVPYRGYHPSLGLGISYGIPTKMLSPRISWVSWIP